MKFLMSPTKVNSLVMTNHFKVTVICGNSLIKGSNPCRPPVCFLGLQMKETLLFFVTFIYFYLTNCTPCPRKSWVIPPAIWVYKLTNFHIQFIQKLSDHYLLYSFRHFQYNTISSFFVRRCSTLGTYICGISCVPH